MHFQPVIYSILAVRIILKTYVISLNFDFRQNKIRTMHISNSKTHAFNVNRLNFNTQCIKLHKVVFDT